VTGTARPERRASDSKPEPPAIAGVWIRRRCWSTTELLIIHRQVELNHVAGLSGLSATEAYNGRFGLRPNNPAGSKSCSTRFINLNFADCGLFLMTRNDPFSKKNLGDGWNR
jgi:hypothetical protein